MDRGAKIQNPTEKIFITEQTPISRRAIKHIVESRMKDGLKTDQIDHLFKKAPETILFPEIEYLNKQEKYPGSIIRGKFDNTTQQGIMVLLDKENGSIRDIITLYGKEAKQFFKKKRQIKNQPSSPGGTAP